MKSKFYINLFLFGFVISLIFFIKFWPTPKVDRSLPISDLQIKNIKSIGMLRKNRAEIKMRKSGETWHITSPVTARVSEFQIDRVLEIAEARSNYSTSQFDRISFGLNQPEIIVTINSQKFIFGNINTVTNEQYLETDGKLYLVATHLGYSVPDEPMKLLSRKLLSSDEIPQVISFKSWEVLQKNTGAWRVKGVIPKTHNMDISADSFNHWVKGWEMTSSLSTEFYQGALSGIKAIIETSSGKTIEFNIIKNDRGYLFVRLDEMIGYQLGNDAGKRLLDPYEIVASQA